MPTMKMKTELKQPRTYRLSNEALVLLEKLSVGFGISATDVIEIGIRKLANLEGLDYQKLILKTAIPDYHAATPYQLSGGKATYNEKVRARAREKNMARLSAVAKN